MCLKCKESFQTKNRKKAIKDKIIRDIRTYFDSKKRDYFKQVRIGNAYNNYIEYENNGNKKKILSVKSIPLVP